MHTDTLPGGRIRIISEVPGRGQPARGSATSKNAPFDTGVEASEGDPVVTASGPAPNDAFVNRQIGAHPTLSAETTRLFIRAPREVGALFRAVLCTVRREIERQTNRMPSEGEAFEAMLDH